MARIYIYVVDRDFGFAPNPFHGSCTLATCKPIIRRTAQLGDWIFGVGGKRLKATGRCIYAMKVDETMTFDDYWIDPRFRIKKPVRNGSRAMVVGDNIYHREELSAPWQQLDSHHSLPNGEPNPENIDQDTQTNRMLISRCFLYFGEGAPMIPPEILAEINYTNGRNHRLFDFQHGKALVDWLMKEHGKSINQVSGDPYQFGESSKRYHAQTNSIR